MFSFHQKRRDPQEMWCTKPRAAFNLLQSQKNILDLKAIQQGVYTLKWVNHTITGIFFNKTAQTESENELNSD